MVFFVGAVISPLYDRGHLRLLLTVGSFCIVFGHMMLSLCTEYWQALLAQGFLVGIGSGCLFVPSLAVMQPYFSTRLGLAVGIAVTGSSARGIIYHVIFTNLIDHVGFGWTVRVLGFVALATLLIPLAFSKMCTKPPGVRKMVDLSAFTDGPYMLCILGCLLGYTGCYTAFYYISFYGEAKGWMSTSLSLYLVPILNAASAFGRVLPNWLSDKNQPYQCFDSRYITSHIKQTLSNLPSRCIHDGRFIALQLGSPQRSWNHLHRCFPRFLLGGFHRHSPTRIYQFD
jgi:predicted MFS family arabinose efflux permease